MRTATEGGRCFQPQPAHEVYYRLAVGANAASKYDAVSGFITDVLDPRYGKDDPTWNGDWLAESRIDAETHRWQTLITIPFHVLAAEPPAPGITWRANFARHHDLPRERVDRSLWSTTINSTSMDDRSTFGVILFELLSHVASGNGTLVPLKEAIQQLVLARNPTNSKSFNAFVVGAMPGRTL